jgi:hypothetical protein
MAKGKKAFKRGLRQTNIERRDDKVNASEEVTK